MMIKKIMKETTSNALQYRYSYGRLINVQGWARIGPESDPALASVNSESVLWHILRCLSTGTPFVDMVIPGMDKYYYQL